MHPAPIKVTSRDQIPPSAMYIQTLTSGEDIYRTIGGVVYALQP